MGEEQPLAFAKTGNTEERRPGRS